MNGVGGAQGWVRGSKLGCAAKNGLRNRFQSKIAAPKQRFVSVNHNLIAATQRPDQGLDDCQLTAYHRNASRVTGLPQRLKQRSIVWHGLDAVDERVGV